ncbi:MAG: AAA family ATPase [Oleiphilus sp.]|nr:MAG: AAA family ATPase [Oleiphilus sp.]
MVENKVLKLIKSKPGIHFEEVAKELDLLPGRVLHAITRSLNGKVTLKNGLCTVNAGVEIAEELVPAESSTSANNERKVDTERPFFRLATNELEALAKKDWSDVSKLKEIHKEALRRNKSAGVRLAAKLSQRIRAIESTPVKQSNHKESKEAMTELSAQPASEKEEFLEPRREYKVMEKKNTYQSPQSNKGFAYDSLEALRNKLLDLTGRNRLLNFRHGRGGFVRVIDELPDQLQELLLSDTALRFLPVPEPTKDELIEAGYIELDELGQEVRLQKDPTAKEWAKYLGLETNYELPAHTVATEEEEKHQDLCIQTLLFPYELETQLRGIRSKAQTAIEETGANILYLAFGFLQWFERNDSEVERLAPLYLVPVRLEKGFLDKERGTYSYTLQYTGEDIVTNLSLREKLKIDFGIALPELDEHTTPEQYFEDVQDRIVRNQPSWRVKRFCTLALLNFGKLLMYLDLDPARWPQGDKNIANHEIVKRFFATHAMTSEGGAGFSEEYEIDQLKGVHEQFPLIDDADSSQHSALVDVIKGKNLVIEGPPGTGKSQTITNLIAAAILQGKRVLFVAEKMAALHVVKNRLDKAGLGDFCLELHSHKTQKKKVYEDLNHRLGNQGHFRSPEKIEVEIARYEDLKKQLNDHAELINSVWKGTGLSIHKILTAATGYRQKLSLDASEVHPEGISGDSFSEVLQKKILDDIRLYKDVYEQVRKQIDSDIDLSFHPWFGVNNTSIQLFDSDAVCRLLQDWQDELEQISNVAGEFSELLSPESDQFDQLANLKKVSEGIKSLPFLTGDECLSALTGLDEANTSKIEDHLAKFDAANGLYVSLVSKIRKELIGDSDSLNELKQDLGSLESLGVAKDLSFEDVYRLTLKLEELNVGFERLKSIVEEVSSQLGGEAGKFIDPSIDGIKELKQLITLAMQIDGSLITHRSVCFDEPDLDRLIPELNESLKSLVPQYEQLKKLFVLDALPDSQTLIGLRNTLETSGAFKWFKGAWRDARKAIKSLSILPNAKFNDLASQLSSLIDYKEEREKFDAISEYEKALGAWFKGLDTSIDDIAALRGWYKHIREVYGVGFGPKVAVGQSLLDMDSHTLRGLQHLESQGVLQSIEDIESSYSYLSERLPRASIFNASDMLLNDEENGLSKLKQEIENRLSSCQSSIVDNCSLSDFAETIAGMARFDDLDHSLSKTTPVLLELFGEDSVLQFGQRETVEKSSSKIKATLKLAEVINNLETEELVVAIRRNPTKELFDNLAEMAGRLNKSLNDSEASKGEFVSKTNLDIDLWTKETGDRLSDLRTRNQIALSNPSWLSSWVDFVRCREELCHKGFDKLISKVEQQEVSLEDIEDVYALATYDLLAREIIESRPALAHFSGAKQNGIQNQFREYDEKLKSLQREKIAWKVAQNEAPIGNSGGKVSNYTELSLIRHEANKKTKHAPVRQLTKRSGKALSALKPCFMMGPMSVAQYLEPGEVEFDLVVMDEASQIKPEDALGAIARGKQLVVVGDPKQLPPTNFFNKAIEQDEDDTTAIEQSESILDVALPMFSARRLRWHYRSKHESLIAFSNQSFYDSNLVVFPSPHSESDEFGIKFVPIPRGRFVNRRNIEEATVIAESVMRHLLHRKDESLGVVAMSAEQREQLERCVEELSKENVEFREALEENQLTEEPLFIKNLENVQGDERDVIYISCTYGPQEAGATSMPQRFGPINSPVGGRRLNVLFTRSKKRMHVFSSMTEGHIRTSEQSTSGLIALKNFLAFAQSGVIQQPVHTGRAPDSEFEISVAESLRRYGYECEPQVGVAGFFIDLAVKDPGQPGRFLVGVECDGANYHSAKSARDRDRLRQDVLERLGWKIRRIWSTDWFKNPHAQIEPLVRELNELRTPITYEPEVNEHEETEVEEIDEIIHEVEEHVEQALLFNEAGLSLKEKLVKFDQEVIGSESDGVDPAKRLLRPSMLEALLEFRPISKSEFQESIPAFLREGIDGKQGKYLEPVLNIIAEDEMEED